MVIYSIIDYALHSYVGAVRPDITVLVDRASNTNLRSLSSDHICSEEDVWLPVWQVNKNRPHNAILTPYRLH